jgi:hypothetical protein
MLQDLVEVYQVHPPLHTVVLLAQVRQQEDYMVWLGNNTWAVWLKVPLL